METRVRERKGERAWVHGLVPRLQKALASLALPGGTVTVEDEAKLPYASVIQAYSRDGAATFGSSSYETDLLVSDTDGEGRWTPRVVVECKLGGVTTHDALSYVAKAETHKHLHPYLRYGVLVGQLAFVPTFLVRHGIDFDFLATWLDAQPDSRTWQDFVETLAAEVTASRILQGILSQRRSAVRYRLIRRPLALTEA